MTHWRELITAGRCGMATSPKGMKRQFISGATPTCAAQTYLIEVNFDRLHDESERNHLKHLPTSFHIAPSDVDRLKAAARKVLTDSAEFKNLIEDMQ